ncbi:MAG: PD-(D/E)XK nuclease family protein [Salinivirgaceae bacterium]|nr:PD-(D/E)XK nuclease family protein [Salinivirgaceae bacterium]
MENLLKQLFIIHKEYKMLADREEKFNIFTTLHKFNDERRLHSRFISVLLQPKGTHGFENQFLNLFLEEVNISGILMATNDIDDEELEANKESNDNEEKNPPLISYKLSPDSIVYPAENNKKENNNIDILIIDRVKKQCLIIENKIYAGDSNGAGGKQLERYIDHAENIENIPINNISVIYLTLDGHDPSKSSVGSYYGKKDIILCSYQDLIVTWLEKCLKLTIRTPFLRESIIQYIKLIKSMTTDSSSVEERKAYRSLVGESKENMLAAQKLMQNFKHIKWHAVSDFWYALQSIIEQNNYNITKRVIDINGNSQVITDLTHYEIYRKGQKNKQKCILNFIISDGLEITVRFTPDGGFYFGVSNKVEVNPAVQSKLNKLTGDDSIYQNTKWMHLHKKFNKQIIFNDFNSDITFGLINAERNKKLVEETWSEVAQFIEDFNR